MTQRYILAAIIGSLVGCVWLATFATYDHGLPSWNPQYVQWHDYRPGEWDLVRQAIVLRVCQEFLANGYWFVVLPGAAGAGFIWLTEHGKNSPVLRVISNRLLLFVCGIPLLVIEMFIGFLIYTKASNPEIWIYQAWCQASAFALCCGAGLAMFLITAELLVGSVALLYKFAVKRPAQAIASAIRGLNGAE